MRVFSVMLALCFIPGAIPLGLVFAGQRFLANTKIIYSPLVITSTICFLSSAAG